MSRRFRTALMLALPLAMLGRVAASQHTTHDGPHFTSDRKLMLPTGYRKWTFIGAPLTPNGLNNGKAGFPEFHNVYVQDKNLTAYQRDAQPFPKGL